MPCVPCLPYGCHAFSQDLDPRRCTFPVGELETGQSQACNPLGKFRLAFLGPPTHLAHMAAFAFWLSGNREVSTLWLPSRRFPLRRRLGNRRPVTQCILNSVEVKIKLVSRITASHKMFCAAVGGNRQTVSTCLHILV